MEDPEAWGWGWKKKRASGDERATRFVTFSCEKRWPLFHRETTRDAFVAALREAEGQGDFSVRAFVVMPEHVHLLLCPASRVPLPMGLARLKSVFARDTLARWELERPEAVAKLTRADGSRRFWLRGGGHDRWMRDTDEARKKAVYIHANPVRRGLVDRPTAYAWSSAWRGWGVWADQA